MKRTLCLLLTAFLTGCSATGPRFAEHPASTTAVSAANGRLIVFRLSNSPQYSIRAARLELDRRSVGEVMPAGFHVFEVTPGTHSLVADLWDAPGRCEFDFDIAAGSTYYVEIAPRPEAWLSGAGALAGAPTPAGWLVGVALSLGGMAAESAGKTCGGAFSISPVESNEARSKLLELRSSQ